MNRRPQRNQRRSPRSRNLLEVSVRSQLANKQRNRKLAVFFTKLALFALLVSGVVYGAKEGFRQFFWENPKYNLAVVEIHNPGASLSRELILESSGLTIGENIFQLSLSDAQEALSELPQVETVDLRRVLPNKITIDMTERRPIAWLAEAGVDDAANAESSWLVDDNGIIFKPKRLMPTYLRLPVIYGVPPQNYLPGDRVTVPELTAAIELIRRNGETGRMGIRTVDLRKGYCILVTDARGRKISFPLDEAGRHLDRLAAVLEATTQRGMEVQTVNLLVRQNVPVTLVNHTGDDLPPEPRIISEAGEKPPEPVKESKKPEPKKAEPKKSSRSTSTRRASEKKPIPRAVPVNGNIPRAEPVR